MFMIYLLKKDLMNFYINKNANLPLLKMQVVKDGRSEYQQFMQLLETSSIFFTMINSETGIPKIVSKPAYIVELTSVDENAQTEYYVYFRFTKKDTNKVGTYKGQFLIKSEDGDLILPLREELNIFIQESFIIDSPCC
jgi:hypothetical protein